MAVQEARLAVAMKDLNEAQAELDAKQAELDEVQAQYEKAVREKQVRILLIKIPALNFLYKIFYFKYTSSYFGFNRFVNLVRNAIYCRKNLIFVVFWLFKLPTLTSFKSFAQHLCVFTDITRRC